MLVPFRRTTGAVIPDFQSKASAETLIVNAERAGVPKEDVEIRDIDEAEAKALADAHFAADREQAESARLVRLQASADFQKRMGWTDADVDALRDLLSISG